MTTSELELKLSLISSLEAQRDEINEQIDALKDRVKAEMAAQCTDKITAGNFRASWTKYWRRVFDTTAFRREHKELYDSYVTPKPASIFRISAGGEE